MSSLSQLYPNARHLFATAGISWTSGNYKVLLMASGYTPNFANVYLSDVDASKIIATSPNISGKSEALGVCTGDTINFGLIVDSRAAGSLIFYKDSGTPSSSPLVAYFDTPDVLGFPLVLNGFTYYVYKNVTGGWFRI